MDRFDDAQEEQPREKGFIEKLAERFFPPAKLASDIEKKLPGRRVRPPTGRRRPPAGAPIDKMEPGGKKQGS